VTEEDVVGELEPCPECCALVNPPPLEARHTFVPAKGNPFSCGECGYAEHVDLKHLPEPSVAAYERSASERVKAMTGKDPGFDLKPVRDGHAVDCNDPNCKTCWGGGYGH
jgi:hypothetical protein